MEKNYTKVCVTGGASYLGSFLVKELLDRGYFVHATLRNLGDESKVGVLKGLPHADTRLKLFGADIYNPDAFASAVEGCEFVVHMATPFTHDPNNSQFKNTSELAVAGVKSVMESCIRSTTVKKVIYPASILAASPLNGDGSGYKESVDETCWTPPNISNQYTHESLEAYVYSKKLAEQEALSYNGKGIEVVSLAFGVVGGGTVQSSVSATMRVLISQGLNDSTSYYVLRFTEELMGKIPVMHIQDMADAHIFSMENSNINGRFLCTTGYLKSAEIASLIQKCQPNISISQGLIEDTKRETRWGSRKMEGVGFEYKYDAEKTINDTLVCAKNWGLLSLSAQI